MARLPNITGAELLAVLQKIGFQIVRQKGSHIRLRHEDGRIVTIPIHVGKVIGKGLLLKILRDVELTKDELIDLLD